MSGTLFIVGGGLRAATDEVFSALIARTGGPQARFAFVVTASGEGPDETFSSYVDDFARLGVPREHCVLIPLYAAHVRDARGYNALTGDADGLCELLDGVDGVWFTGGDQYFTAQAFLRADGSDTRLLEALRALYARGGVIGGSSAGAAIMSRVMIGAGNDRGVLCRETVFGYDGYDVLCEAEDPCEPLVLTRGLGFFTEGVVDQHFNRRPRLLRLLEACLRNDEGARVGYAVSEDTALVYHEEEIEVLGSAGVYLLDCRTAIRRGAGSYEGAVLSALHRGDRLDTHTLSVTLAREGEREQTGFARDYVDGLAVCSPQFDAMLDERLLRGRADCLYADADGRPVLMGAVAHEGHGVSYLTVLRYTRLPATRGYRAAHTSLAGVGLSTQTAVVPL